MTPHSIATADVRSPSSAMSGHPRIVVTRLFRTTKWALVRKAATDHEALGEWIGLYWYPLYAWARRRGALPEDAADSVQSFLAKLCEGALLNQVDERRGRLRSWLLTAFGNHLASAHTSAQRLKRGGGVAHVSIDWGSVEDCYLEDEAPSSTPEAVYARTWAVTLMDEALDRLARHYADSGRGPIFEALLPALESPLPDATYAEVAAMLDMSDAALRQAAVRLRQRYRRALLDVAALRLGITSEAQLEEELRVLLAG